MRLENARTAVGMSVIEGPWLRYSGSVVNRPAKPRCQPSTIANANAHPADVAHVIRVSPRHGSRRASCGPHHTAATPIATAGIVPHPIWAFHHPKIGAALATSWGPYGLPRLNGALISRFSSGTTNAATKSTAPNVTATASP